MPLTSPEDRAFDVGLPEYQLVRYSPVAPEGTPLQEGPPEPFDGDPVTESVGTTEMYSASWYFDEVAPPGNLDVVELVDTGDPIDWGYPAAWTDTFLRDGVPHVYFETGVTTFSNEAFQGEPVSQVPNRKGPVYYYADFAAAWEINGTLYLNCSDHTDPAAAQYTGMKLVFALVPEELLIPHDSAGYPGMWQWRDRPTETVLDSLQVVSTYELPDYTAMPWGLAYNGGEAVGQYPLPAYEFSHTITLESPWFVNDRVHLAYWWERADGSRRLDQTFTTLLTGHGDWTLPDAYSDGVLGVIDDNNAFYSLALDTNELDGTWKLEAGAVWLDSTSGATAGPYNGKQDATTTYATFGYGLPYFGVNDRVIGWTFAQVADSTFGMTVAELPDTLPLDPVLGYQYAPQQVVVTPTQVLFTKQRVTTVLDTHSTAFDDGDVCAVRMLASTGQIEVLRNGVLVSSVAAPRAFSATYDYGLMTAMPQFMLWASAPNAGNRMSDLTLDMVPTHLGEVSIGAELDYATARSQLTRVAPVEQRWLFPVGYPRPYLEEGVPGTDQGAVNYYTGEVRKSWVMWLKLETGSNGYVWVGPVDSRARTDPDSAPHWGYYDSFKPAAEVSLVRPDDGKLVTWFRLWSNPGYGLDYDWTLLDDVGTFGVLPDEDYRDTPWDQVPVTPDYTQAYLRLDFGTVEAQGALWSSRLMDDLLLYFVPRPTGPTNAVTWKWQPGDDHDGLQYQGYAYETSLLQPPPTELTYGVALTVEDSIESYLYGTRDGIFGWVEDYGLFWYGTYQEGGMQMPLFGDAGISGGYDQTADHEGNFWTEMNWETRWAGETHLRYRFLQASTWNFTYTGSTTVSVNNYNYGFYGAVPGSTVIKPNGSHEVEWKAAAGGMFLAWGSTDIALMETFNYVWYAKNPRVVAYYSATSDDAGTYFRCNADNTQMFLLSKAHLRWYDHGVMTVLASWAPVADETSLNVEAIDDVIKVTANGVLLATVTSELGLDNLNCGIWATPHGTWDAPAFNPMRLLAFRVTSAELIDDFSVSGDDTFALARLSGPRQTGVSIGKLITGEEGWGQTQNDDLYLSIPWWETRWQVWSPLFPDSLFVLTVGYDQPKPPTYDGFVSNGIGVSWRQFELDKRTGAVIREMTPMVTEFSVAYSNYNDPIVMPGGRYLRQIHPGSLYPYPDRNRMITYDLVTGAITNDVEVLAGHDEFNPLIYNGMLPDGRDVYSADILYRSSSFWLHDPYSDELIELTLAPYVGKGYNGGNMGLAGRHLWGGKLNYHIDPHYYVLQPEDVEGTDVAAGEIVGIGGGGIAQAFVEYFRWDLATDDLIVSANTWYQVTTPYYSGYSMEVSYDSGATFSEAVDTFYPSPRYFDGNVNDIRLRAYDLDGGPYALGDANVTRTAVPGGWEWVFSVRPDYYTEGHVDVHVSVIRTVVNRTVPIEYVVNVEAPKHEQTYGRFVKPQYIIDFGNKLSLNQYTPGDTNDFVPEAGGDDQLSAAGGELRTTGAVRFRTSGLRISDFRYGAFDYYLTTMKVRRVSGPATGYVTLQLAVLLPDGTLYGIPSAAVTYVADMDTGSYTNVTGPYASYPYAYHGDDAGAQLVVWVQAIGVDPDTVLAYTHFNLIPDVFALGYQDLNPADGDIRTVDDWEDVGDGGIQYYFPLQVIPGTFAPWRGNDWRSGAPGWGNEGTPAPDHLGPVQHLNATIATDPVEPAWRDWGWDPPTTGTPIAYTSRVREVTFVGGDPDDWNSYDLHETIADYYGMSFASATPHNLATSAAGHTGEGSLQDSITLSASTYGGVDRAVVMEVFPHSDDEIGNVRRTVSRVIHSP